jgi:hypothetical protein
MKVILTRDEPLYDSLVLEEFQSLEAPIDPSDRRRICKCLVDWGLDLLWREYNNAGKPSDFFAHLARESRPTTKPLVR